MSKPLLSAIVVIPDTYETVRSTMKYLQAQTAAGQIEVVIVAPSLQQIKLDESDLKCFQNWQVVEVGAVTSIGTASLAGIRHANASIVALTEDHSFPDVHWAQIFIAGHQKPWAAIGPSMRNANPDNWLSWADFYMAYGQWAHPVQSGAVRHLPGHNSSYKRDVLLKFGNKLEYLIQAESILHRHLKAEGLTLLLEAGTCTSHLNFTTWSQWLPVQYYSGRVFAATWSKTWSLPRRLVYTAGSPLIPLIRLWRIMRDILRRQSAAFALRLLPILIAGLIFNGFGQMAGYATGVNDAIEKITKYEFHRTK